MSKPFLEQPEQDSSGDGGLPTYQAVADQQGPNSRFGRWKTWIEKRAAERYADITPAEAARRIARGWGESRETEQTTPGRNLHVQTEFQGPPPNYPSTPPQTSPPPFIGEPIPPTHLRISQFGSRFLPHSTAPIRCLLPLLSDHLLLIGHDEGLSVLNMYPKEWTEEGLSDFGPIGAAARVVWEGEPVYQLSLLEVEGDDSGIVLALVGSCQKAECPKDSDSIRTLRMYNLSSLLSLAKWAASNQYNGPLDLRRTPSGNPQNGPKKKSHKSQTSLTRGLKSLGIESPISQTVRPFDVFSSNKSASSMSSLATAVEEDSSSRTHTSARSNSEGTIDSSWDVIQDLPLKWASDYVSLATRGSRLAHTNVLFYDTWSDETARGRRGALLAVGTKSAILLYETPRGERAFRFVKEFYTPLTPRSMSFVHQSLADPISRSPSDIGPSRATRSSPSKIAAHISSHQRSTSMVVPSIRCPNHLSIFVTFEKKAGIIRIFDSSVGEVELYDEGAPTQSTTTTSHNSLLAPTGTISKRNRASWDGFNFIKDKPNWILPTKVDLAATIAHSNVYLLTRSKRTHIVPYPLPASLPTTPSYRILTWSSAPKHVQARVCRSPLGAEAQPPFLQLIAFGEDGVEVQEIPLHSLSERKGKGRAVQPVHATEDLLGGETAPLCNGGHWHLPQGTDLARFNSVTSYATATSFDSYETDEIAARFRAEQGIYGWVRKGIADWRVFWLGGTGEKVEEERI